jgi:PAS domain S-box-containing protein
MTHQEPGGSSELPEETRPDKASDPANGARLLLVDDDVGAIQVMSRMLAQYPDQRFATSGAAALRLAREARPDLILLDVEMPGMSGFDVCDALQADPLLSDIPIIFATSYAGTPLHVAALKSGAADFITKPIVAAQLTARVRAQLRASQMAQDLKRDCLATAAGQSPNVEIPRILIVDDDTSSIQILRRTLAHMGDLHFAKNGEQALLLARNLLPDLILLDAHMPGIDGFEVCRALKAEATFRHVPIAFVTRFSDPRHEMRALELGAADFIAKPYTGAILQARARKLLDLKRRTDADLRAVSEHWRQVGDTRVADIVGAASDGIVTYNADETVVMINAAACRMFGVAHERAIGSRIGSLLGDDPSTPDALRGGPSRTLLSRPNGELFPVEVTLSSVGVATDLLTTMILRDTSDRERLEEATRSRIEAEAASRTKTLMMSYIAHEIGNPLNGLLGFTELMACDGDNPLEPAQAQRLEYIATCGRQLQALMRDVMDVGRFETGNLAVELRAVDAVACAQAALQAVSAQAANAGVSLLLAPVQPSIGVMADADRLHQCLVNLLTNAIKYNRRGGRARIELTIVSDHVDIAVHDEGVGMDAAQRQHLFEPFNRLGRQGGAAAGAGLGLMITRQLVEAMRGQLRIESDPGSGSCFTIVLPHSIDIGTGGCSERSDPSTPEAHRHQ